MLQSGLQVHGNYILLIKRTFPYFRIENLGKKLIVVVEIVRYFFFFYTQVKQRPDKNGWSVNLFQIAMSAILGVRYIFRVCFKRLTRVITILGGIKT